jgi:drug/metabolite transporter (DMT)-like permease
MTNVLLFLSTVLIWGSTWIAIKLQLGPVPALVSVFYRFASAAAIFMLALALLGKLSVPERRHQPFVVAQALCLFCCNFLCFYVASRYIPSGLAAVVFSLASVFNALNARLFFGDAISPRALLAGALGVVGVALLFARDLFLSFDAGAATGLGLSFLGTILFSLGNMVSRRNGAAGLPLPLANAWGMTYGAAILLALVALTGTPLVPPPDAAYWAALGYLSLFGTVIGFTTYLMLVARIGSARAAYLTVVSPVVALTLSTLFEGYRWTPSSIAGLALTMAGNVVMFARRRASVVEAQAEPSRARGRGDDGA